MNARSDTTSRTAQSASKKACTNRLAQESSPYLLQHAHNPVDWYPWGDEALRRAREEHKPIFLSIGYSACHWCHVMERESFENPDIAQVLNAHFVSIKVDREQRPDLDQIYMRAVQMMTGSGGWPLSAFLTPDLKPFFGGTYFPPEERYGRPGFKRLLERIAEIWREDATGVQRNAEELTRAIESGIGERHPSSAALDVSLLANAASELARTFDAQWGGFGGAPKFPPSGAVALLLREHLHTGDPRWLGMATVTLDRMARGGMYDQLGGGFHRYSTDERWLVPHFEKMLYDNALLAQTYLEAWQVTHVDLYRRIAGDTLDYVVRDMTDARGGCYSAEDADSEGCEGQFYVWRPEEIVTALGAHDGAFFCECYGVSAGGNFDGQNILNVTQEPAEFAREKGISLEELERRLVPLREKLREVRNRRVRPARDDKILAAWNGMTIAALARGYQSLGEQRFLAAAERAAEFVLTEMVRDGALLRTVRPVGPTVHGHGPPGYLDDYAEMANGLVDLYEASFELRWLEAADTLTRRMLAEFWDEQGGGFFYTTADQCDLLVRMRPEPDGSVPSGDSTAALVLLRLSRLLDNAEYRKRAETVLGLLRERMLAYPGACPNLLCAAVFDFRPGPEIAVVGLRGSDETRWLLDVIRSRFIPNKIVALLEPDTPAARVATEQIPLLAGKTTVSTKTTVYVCENFICQQPVTEPAALEKILGGVR